MIFYLLGWMRSADIAKASGFIRKSGAVLLAGVAALLITRNPGLAIMAGMAAYSLLKRTGWWSGGGGGASSPSASAVRTPYLEMSLDHATGTVSGQVLRGRYAGRSLPDLTLAERLDVLAELRANDAQGAQLFAAWLDRASPGWKSAEGQGQGSGQGGSGQSGMSVDKAYLVLGLSPGATREDVHAAHRNLMKRFHPDQGGTTYLASQVNEAKDVLLQHIKS